MEQKPLVIHCTYDEHGPELRDLIMNSFRLFVQARIGIFANHTEDALS